MEVLTKDCRDAQELANTLLWAAGVTGLIPTAVVEDGEGRCHIVNVQQLLAWCRDWWTDGRCKRSRAFRHPRISAKQQTCGVLRIGSWQLQISLREETVPKA